MPLIFILGCASTDELQNISTKEFPVKLIVSNQNGFSNESVHIIVKIKEYSKSRELSDSSHIIIVDQGFFWKTGHSFPSFNLNLKEGSYWISAESKNTNNKLYVIFEVDRPMTIYLSYLDNEQFRLHISYTPLVFG
jgi:hypothetical protein